jgi:hypothetical protein
MKIVYNIHSDNKIMYFNNIIVKRIIYSSYIMYIYYKIINSYNIIQNVEIIGIG